jgi:hypothetical protein
VERSSNDDLPMYTVHYVVRASILLPLSGPLSQRAIACCERSFLMVCLFARVS